MVNTPIFKTMKVFDCQWDPGMPEDVKKAFFSIFEGTGNDCYVDYTIADSVWKEDQGLDYKLIDKWLIENGAAELETVLIKHWW